MSENTNIQNTPQTAPDNAQAYWKANVRIIVGCLVVWAVCSLGLGIVFRSALMGVQIMGTDIGLWFGQQGSILTFVGLCFFYAWRMNKLDKQFGVEED